LTDDSDGKLFLATPNTYVHGANTFRRDTTLRGSVLNDAMKYSKSEMIMHGIPVIQSRKFIRLGQRTLITGVCTIYGNVWERCEDVYKNNYKDVPNNGTAWTNSGGENITHVMRGGSANTTSDRCYSSFRRKFGRLVADEFNGFRIVVL